MMNHLHLNILLVWLFANKNYSLHSLKRKKRRESTFITLIYQMIMTFNAVSNFALSQMCNCKYNDILWFMPRFSHRIWGTILVWIFFSSNYLVICWCLHDLYAIEPNYSTWVIELINWGQAILTQQPSTWYQILHCLKCLIANTTTFIDSWLGPLIEYDEPSSFEYSSRVIIC